nr:hypothetical protein [Tanacetum cinerariifolium]
MRERSYASWERAQRHMERSGECLGTVQMSCRYTGGSMGEGVVLAGKLFDWREEFFRESTPPVADLAGSSGGGDGVRGGDVVLMVAIK